MDSDKAEGEPSPKRQRTSFFCNQKPNFFVAVQVSNPEIHREISVLQKFITAKKPLFKSTLINLITLHITLCTLHLPKNGDIKRAKSALITLETNMKEVLIKDPISLKFKGIGSFKNEVIFAKIESGEPLKRFKDLQINLVQALKDEGLIVKDKFEPHLTLMKMSRDRYLRKKKIFKIPKDLYAEHNEMLFGDQIVKGVQLLKMACRSPDGYYQCYHHFDLGIQSDEIEDHHHCCGVKSVFPSLLIELNPKSSDDETEEIFNDISKVLDEIRDIEESETEEARKYLKKFEVNEEVSYNSLDYAGKKSSAKVVCSSKIDMKRKKVQNKRMKLKRSKISEDGVNMESSELKMKRLEIEDVEDLGLKFLMEEIEVEDVKIHDDYAKVENVDLEVTQVIDENAEIEVCPAKSTNPTVELLSCEETVVCEKAGSSVDTTVKEGLKIEGELKKDESMKGENLDSNIEELDQDLAADLVTEVKRKKDSYELKGPPDVTGVNPDEFKGGSNFKSLEDGVGKAIAKEPDRQIENVNDERKEGV